MIRQVFKHILDISDPFQGILLDAYGVFWGGNAIGLLPGSRAAMARLVADGKIVGILSNTSQLAHMEIEKLALAGLIQGVHFHFMLTAGGVAKTLFQNLQLPFKISHKRFCLFGEPHPKWTSHHLLFQDTPFHETIHHHEADFLYISIPHLNGEDQTDPSLFSDMIHAVRGCGVPMVCTNPDLYAFEGRPPKAVVRQGVIAALYEEIDGEVFYIGKPSSVVFTEAMSRFSQFSVSGVSQVLMVGDTPETDVRGARAFGMASALLTHTGMVADRIRHQGWHKTVEKLELSDTPDFFVERLGTYEL